MSVTGGANGTGRGVIDVVVVVVDDVTIVVVIVVVAVVAGSRTSWNWSEDKVWAISCKHPRTSEMSLAKAASEEEEEGEELSRPKGALEATGSVSSTSSSLSASMTLM